MHFEGHLQQTHLPSQCLGSHQFEWWRYLWVPLIQVLPSSSRLLIRKFQHHLRRNQNAGSSADLVCSACPFEHSLVLQKAYSSWLLDVGQEYLMSETMFE